MNLLAGHGNCQNYTVRNYTTNQGLPHNNVRAIVQDSTGYLWLATWDGLSRFDGYDFKNYFHEAADPSSLPYFSIYNLCIDRYNNLWILPDNSTVVKYNRTADNLLQ